MRKLPLLALTRINLEVGGEMLRIGFGKNSGRWFFRIDLWKIAYRITFNDKNKNK